MATCPNKNLQEWKDLVAMRGEDLAHYLWNKHEGAVPGEEYLSPDERREAMSFDEVEKVSNLILNKLRPRRKGFYVRDEKKAKNEYWYSSPRNIAFVTAKEMLISIIGTSVGFDMGKEYTIADIKEKIVDVVNNNNISFWEYKLNKLNEWNNDFPVYIDKLYQEKRVIQEFLKYNSISAINKFEVGQQMIIREAMPNLFKENKYKSEKQALFLEGRRALAVIDKRIPALQKKNMLTLAKQKAIQGKYETLINFARIVPDYKTRIINRIYNEIDRRLEYREKAINEKPWIKDVLQFRYLYDQASMQKVRDNYAKAYTKFGNNDNIDTYLEEINYNAETGEIVGETSTHEVMKKIATSNTEYAELAKVLLNYTKKNNRPLFFYNGGMDAIGQYKLTANDEGTAIKADAVLIDYSHTFYKHVPEQLLIHEIVHSLTVAAIDTQGSNDRSRWSGLTTMDMFVNYVSDQIAILSDREQQKNSFFNMFMGETQPYGLSNVYEFITETLSDPAFATLLKQIPAIDKTQFKSVFHEILDFVLGLFNIKKEETAYDQALQLIDGYLNKQAEMQVYEEVDNYNDLMGLLYQLKGTESTTASPTVLSQVKKAASKMGIKFNTLTEYAKQHPNIDVSDANALSDLLKGVVAIAEGREDVALTEEVVHIATAILEQTNPDIVTKLLGQINKYQIYQDTLKQYKNNKHYQTSDGKPNIRKIKKEALDKLLVEVIVRGDKDLNAFPELAYAQNVNMFRRIWDSILQAIRSLTKKSDINIIQQVAATVSLGEVGGTVSDLTSDEIYLQTAENAEVNEIYDRIISINSDMEYVPEVKDEKGNIVTRRHYKYKGKEIARSVTEKVNENKQFRDIEDNVWKMQWGDEGHAYLHMYIQNNLLDDRGYKKTPTNVSISTTLNKNVRASIQLFAQDLINSYPPGTRFVQEVMMVNETVKGGLAGRSDFIAIIPPNKEMGNTKPLIDILDWKFTSFNSNKYEDLSPGKQKAWKMQMAEYTNMMFTPLYRMDKDSIRKARMIPFISHYMYNVPMVPTSGLYLTKIEYGDINNPKNTKIHMLPVPTDIESTGNARVDQLISALEKQRNKMFKKLVDHKEKFEKTAQMAEITKAIKKLRVQLDFAPLYNVGLDLNRKVKKAMEEYKKIDFNKLSLEKTQPILNELLEFEASLEKFATLREVYNDFLGRDANDLTPEESLTKRKIERVSLDASQLRKDILELQKDFVKVDALRRGVVSEDNLDDVLKAEAKIDWLSHSFKEASRLPAKIIKLAANRILGYKKTADIVVNRRIQEFGKLLLDLENVATSMGVKAFDLIGKVNKADIEYATEEDMLNDQRNQKPGSVLYIKNKNVFYMKTENTTGKISDYKFTTSNDLTLINKIDREYYDKQREAIEKEDKKFFISNMDVQAYKKQIADILKENFAIIDETIYTEDGNENEKRRKAAKASLQGKIDIFSKNFYGFNEGYFLYLYKQNFLEEKHYSEDFKKLKKNEPAFKVWEFFMGLNAEARDLGYLTREKQSFFPLLEATSLDKLKQTKSIGKQSIDFFKDVYMSRINETLDYNTFDPETGEIRKSIPKYFTKTDKNVEQLSKDLNLVGALWINALEQYKTSKALEDYLHTLHMVESSKGSLIKSGTELITDPNENPNAKLLETITDDAVYHKREQADSLGNKVINFGTDKLAKNQEDSERYGLNARKTINSANDLVRLLALGLKVPLGVANYVGTQMQSFIKTGEFYTWRDYWTSHGKVMFSNLGTLTDVEKGMLDLFVPLNDDTALEARRKIAWKEGYLKYLSTWGFTDTLMLTMQFPEKKLQLANGMAFLKNTIVKDGQLLNARQYLKQQDRKNRKNLTADERRELRKTFKTRVEELLDSEIALKNVIEVNDQGVSIPGVSDQVIGEYRAKIIDYNRTLNGMMDENDKMGFRRDTMFSSFMMFKSWIPKLVYVRTQGLEKNIQTGNWEYGRMRVFLKTLFYKDMENVNLDKEATRAFYTRWNMSIMHSIRNFNDILRNTDRGIEIINKMLHDKKMKHLRETGQKLDISEEEFQDIIRDALINEAKELGLLLTVMGSYIGAAIAEPPEDATPLEINRYKWYYRQINKIADEITFYYNPTSTEAMLQGTFFPAINLLSKIKKFSVQLGGEVWGELSGSEDLVDDSHPTKYFFNLVPILSQFQHEYLPYLDPELAKEMGIRVTKESRKN